LLVVGGLLLQTGSLQHGGLSVTAMTVWSLWARGLRRQRCRGREWRPTVFVVLPVNREVAISGEVRRRRAWHGGKAAGGEVRRWSSGKARGRRRDSRCVTTPDFRWGKPESLYLCDSPGISGYRVQISSHKVNHIRTSHHTNNGT
jgi:hypothetical protein